MPGRPGRCCWDWCSWSPPTARAGTRTTSAPSSTRSGRRNWISLFTATQVALIALALQAGLGTALLLGVRHLVVLLPHRGPGPSFLIFLGRTQTTGSSPKGLREPGSCGCFGSLIERTPAEAFWQNLFLMAPLTLLCFWRRPKSGGLPKRRLVPALLAALGVSLWAYRITDIEFIEGGSSAGFTGRDLPVRSQSELLPDHRTTGPKIEPGSTNRKGASGFLIQVPGQDGPLLMDLRTSTVRSIDPGLVRTVLGRGVGIDGFSPKRRRGHRSPRAAAGVRFELGGRTFILGPPAR